MGIDLIQHRYGWTDDTIKSLPICRFYQIQEVCAKALIRENHDRNLGIALSNWLICQHISGSVGGKPVDFGKWTRAYYPALEIPQFTEEEKAKMKRKIKLQEKEAMDNVERINTALKDGHIKVSGRRSMG